MERSGKSPGTGTECVHFLWRGLFPQTHIERSNQDIIDQNRQDGDIGILASREKTPDQSGIPRQHRSSRPTTRQCGPKFCNLLNG